MAKEYSGTTTIRSASQLADKKPVKTTKKK